MLHSSLLMQRPSSCLMHALSSLGRSFSGIRDVRCLICLIAISMISVFSILPWPWRKLWEIKKQVQTNGFALSPLISHKLQLFTARKRSLGQGNVFTAVCHSVHRGRGSPWQRPPWTEPPDGDPLDSDPPLLGKRPFQTGTSPLDRDLPPFLHITSPCPSPSKSPSKFNNGEGDFDRQSESSTHSVHYSTHQNNHWQQVNLTGTLTLRANRS